MYANREGEVCALKSVGAFFRREPVLVISALAAVLSMLAVPPSAAYIEYIDLRVLCLLFCLMAVVDGLKGCGLFAVLAQRLLTGRGSLRRVSMILVLLPFFTSMLVTNDVSLITFVPFAVLILNAIGRTDRLIPIVALQTVAANLGSMATPVGNPQNLFIYAKYSLGAGEFFGAVLPVAGLSLVLLVAAVAFGPKDGIEVNFGERAEITHKKRLALCVLLFIVCLLAVMRVVHYGLVTGLVFLTLLVADRAALKQVDYCLLLTFVFFFVFAGNIGNIPAVNDALTGMLSGSTFFTSLLASQVISNVPAAVLLGSFTQDWRGLLLGTDVGGLGTLIASLASLISFKLYCAVPGARAGKYLAWFTIANLAALAVLVPLSLLLL